VIFFGVSFVNPTYSLICSFVPGHGKWSGSIEKATQDMIKNGLEILNRSMPDRSNCINRFFYESPPGKWNELNFNNFYVKDPSGWNTKKVLLSYQPAGLVQVSYDLVGNGVNIESSMLAAGIKSVQEETFEPFYPFYNKSLLFFFMADLANNII
jgi:hypothetical protein